MTVVGENKSLPSHVPSPIVTDPVALVTPVKEQPDDLSSPSPNLIQHMDARSRALGRKAELEELRSKRLAKNIRRELNVGYCDSMPLSSAELTEFFLHQKEMQKEWRERQKDSIAYLHSYKNSTVASIQSSPPNEKQHAFSASGYSEIDVFHQKLKESEQEWRRQQKDSIEYLHSYRDDGTASTGDEQSVRPALITPSRTSLVEEENEADMSFAFDELQKALEDRFILAVNCPLPDSPLLSPSVQNTNFDFDEGAVPGLSLSNTDATLAGARNVDIICSASIAGNISSTSQEDATYDMRQKGTPEERESASLNVLDVSDSLVEDSRHSAAKDDPNEIHDIQETDLPADPHDGTNDEYAEVEQVSLDDNNADPGVGGCLDVLPVITVLTQPEVRGTGKDVTVQQGKPVPPTGDLIESDIVSDVKDALMITDQHAPGDHEMSTVKENETEKEANREANTWTPATSELCDVCASMSVDIKEVDELVADTFPDISTDNVSDILDELLEVEDGGGRFERQVGVADETKKVCALRGVRRCVTAPHALQSCKSELIVEPQPISSRTPPRQSAGKKCESKIVLPRKRMSKVDDLGANEGLPRFMRPISSTPERKIKNPMSMHSPKKRVPTYTRREIAKSQNCSRVWISDLHGTRDGCERCLHFASAKERQKFRDEGHQYRISSVRGGCVRECPCFPRKEDEMPVRLCRKCFYDTHKLGKL